MAYHYQCAGCYCTTYMEAVKQGEPMHSVVNGDLCSSCESEKEAELYDNDDD